MLKKLDPVYQFMIWFSVTLVLTLFILSMLSNKFMISLIVSLVVSFLGVREK